MRLAWLTDIHLSFVEKERAQDLCRRVLQAEPQAVLISGDIAESRSLEDWLSFLQRSLRLPIYFVLGNHDYYGDSIHHVRTRIGHFVKRARRLHWLNLAGAMELTRDTCVVGHDGWGDARLGDAMKSPVVLNDFMRILDLNHLDKAQRAKRLAQLGDEAAAHMRKHLPDALGRYGTVLVLTHVPPFREASWHEGAISNDDWLPYFTCKALGDVLLKAMQGYPDRRMLVLCGHTHGNGEARILPNLVVRTGGARYRHPAVQHPVIELV